MVVNFKAGDKVIYTGPDLRHFGKVLTILDTYGETKLMYNVKELPYFTPLEYNLRLVTKLDEVLS